MGEETPIALQVGNDVALTNRVPRTRLPSLDDLPIPDDVQADQGWSQLLLEIASHIGARAALAVVEAFGGDNIYVSKDAARSPFHGVIDAEKVARFAYAFGGTRLDIPTGAAEIRRAKRAGLIAAVRAGKMTAADAARIMRISRSYMSHLVNATEEGTGNVQPVLLVHRTDTRQLDLFGDDAN